MLKIQCFECNSFGERCIILWDETLECVICDPGFTPEEAPEVFGFIGMNSLKPVAVILTHGHFDHLLGVKMAAGRFDVPVYMHPADRIIVETNPAAAAVFDMPVPPSDFASIDIEDCSRISFGSHTLEVITTPGHTPGSVSYYCDEEKLLLSGDTLFAGTVGRTDLPGGDYDLLMESVKGKLMGLDGQVDVYPGHGPVTTIADERQKNPFLLPFNEPLDEE